MARLVCPKCGSVVTLLSDMPAIQPACENCGRPMIRPCSELPGGSITWRFLMYVLIALLVYLVVVVIAKGAIAPGQGPPKDPGISVPFEEEYRTWNVQGNSTLN